MTTKMKVQEIRSNHDYGNPTQAEQALVADISNMEPSTWAAWLSEANRLAPWAIVEIKPDGKRSLITVRKPRYRLDKRAVGAKCLITYGKFATYAAPHRHDFEVGDTVHIVSSSRRGFPWFKSEQRNIMSRHLLNASAVGLMHERLDLERNQR